MPELPEVEVVRRGLERTVTGRTVSSAEVLHPRAVRRHLAGPDDFAAVIRGRTIAGTRRRGKYLWLPLAGPAGPASPAAGPASPVAGPAAAASPAAAAGPGGSDADDALLVHLGMSGQLLTGDPARPLAPHDRVRLTFTDDGPDLRLRDQRTFGHVLVARGGASLPAIISHIAPDPLEAAFDGGALIARLRVRRTGIKAALLDQSLVSGIGNIYADEALWRARLHWARPASALRPAQARELLAAVRAVLESALAAGGTSFDSLYVNVDGESGYFGRSLAVYGRAGEPCLRCGTPVRRDAFANRSAYSCPRCQPRPRPRKPPADLRDRST